MDTNGDETQTTEPPRRQLAAAPKTVDQVLIALLHGGPLSQREIVARTGFSPATVANCVSELISSGDVRQLPDRPARGPGRRESELAATVNGAQVVGISVLVDSAVNQDSGTLETRWWVEAVVTDRTATPACHGLVSRDPLLYQGTRHVVRGGTPIDVSQVVTEISDVLEGFRAEATRQGRNIFGVGVELGGHIEPKSGKVVFAPHLGWRDEPLLERLSSLDATLRITVVNDVNAFAVWEALNPDRPDNFAVVLVGDGIGGALVVNRAVLTGSRGGAGEIGHIPLTSGGQTCICGRRGCVETVASYRAIRLAARQAGWSPTNQHVNRVVEIAKTGDRTARTAARRILAHAARGLSIGLISLANVVDAEEIIVLSTALAASPHFRDALTKEVRAGVFPSFESMNVSVMATEHWHGPIGAAWTAILQNPRARSSA